MHKYNIPINKKKVQVSKIDVIVIGAVIVFLVMILGDDVRFWINEPPAIKEESVSDGAVDLGRDDLNAVEDSSEEDDDQMLAASGIDQVTSPPEPTVLSQTSNGVEMTASNFRRDGEYIKVDMCFDMPDKSDWMLDLTPTLMFGIGQVSLKGFSNLVWNQATEDQMGYRCDAVRFVVPPYADKEEFTLIVPQISAPPREGEVCDFYLNVVQAELDARGSGIIINCNLDAVQYGMGITIEAKPSEMSLEEAMELVMSDEFYSLPGPWEFSFRLEP